MFDTPILLIAFNRPSTTKIVFEELRKLQPQRLYIAVDAPRPYHPTDLEKCNEVKQIVLAVDWPCDVQYLFQPVNLGCSFGPRSAFKWFFSNENAGMILEDDCLPHPSFFIFCKEMLELFKDNKKVISINGSNLGYEVANGNSYTFSRFMNMWGWATWKDRAEQVDYSLQAWKETKNKKIWLWHKTKTNLFDIDLGWIEYWQYQFDKTIREKKITWWDYQWIFHQMSHQLLSVVPASNLVSNIGFNGEGHHTLFENLPAANLPVRELSRPFYYKGQIKPDLVYEEHFIKPIWCDYKRKSLLFYLKMFVSNLLKKGKWAEG